MDNQFDREFAINYIYDEHKSVYGYRPRHLDFSSMSDQELQDLMDSIEIEVIKQLRSKE